MENRQTNSICVYLQHVGRIAKLSLKSKNNEPEQKKANQIQKSARKIWTWFP